MCSTLRQLPGPSDRGYADYHPDGEVKFYEVALAIVSEHTGRAYSTERCRREERDMRSGNLVYILVVIILVLVALLLLSRLI
jgi:hypothetical protein